MSQHTPGPWKAYEVLVNNAPTQWHAGTKKWGAASVAVCDGESNALLIAAAPAMLEALKVLISSREWGTTEERYADGFGLAKAAIAAAEGK